MRGEEEGKETQIVLLLPASHLKHLSQAIFYGRVATGSTRRSTVFCCGSEAVDSFTVSILTLTISSS